MILNLKLNINLKYKKTIFKNLTLPAIKQFKNLDNGNDG